MKLGTCELRSTLRHGVGNWRIWMELPRGPDGKRRRHNETFQGTREQADARLVEICNEKNKGTRIEPSTETVGSYVSRWIEQPHGLQPKTAERYRQLAEQQIIPHLGAIVLQKFTAADVKDWHGTLGARGGKNGAPLSAQTIRHCHRLLHSILEHAVAAKRIPANVAREKTAKPPKVPRAKIEIIHSDRIGEALSKLHGHRLYPLAVTALGTGLRRGELLALRWGRVDLDGASLEVAESLGETKGEGRYFKAPKSDDGTRRVTLPADVVDVLRGLRRERMEQRIALGLGKLPDDALVFCDADGNALSPDKVSRDWARVVVARKLPGVSFHGLRHTHVSMLIAGGENVYAIAKRIGHSDPALTLRVYAKLFDQTDTAAAVIDAVFRLALRS